jgi:hypothetical protein
MADIATTNTGPLMIAVPGGLANVERDLICRTGQSRSADWVETKNPDSPAAQGCAAK